MCRQPSYRLLNRLTPFDRKLLVVLIVCHPSIWMMLPFFLLFSLISGMVNGIAADYLLESLLQYPDFARLPDMVGREVL